MRTKSRFLYNGKVGRWWLQNSRDAVHGRAYRKIADFIRDSFVCEPGMIVDYACGAGQLLSLLSLRFSFSKLVGLDGSSFLLSEARRRMSQLPEQCAERISLIETPLPNMHVLRRKANLAVFCFPNMVPAEADNPEAHGCFLSDGDRQVAASMARIADAWDRIDGTSNAVATQLGLEQARCISYNLRHLLVHGGICVRVEYATMQRHDLSPLELAHVSFEEGSLDAPVEGKMPEQWFRFVASAFFRSLVLEDVYEQTGDERDRKGGYLITVLKAI